MLPRTNSQRISGKRMLSRFIALALIIIWVFPALLIVSSASSAASIIEQPMPAPTPTPTPAFDYTRLVMTTNDLVYDPQSKNILASVPSTASANPNSITPINPETATIGSPVFIGNNPSQMALSGDNLYVGLDAAGAVGRFDLTTLTPELQFSLGSNSSGVLRARDLAALTGLPNSIAVAGANNNPIASIAVYDDATQRPDTITSDSGHYNDLTFIESGTTADRLYALDSRERVLKTVSVTNQGVSVIGELPVRRGEFPLDFRVAEGRAYFTNGDVIDLSTGNLLGRFPGIFNTQDDIFRLVEPDPARGFVYFLYSDSYTSATTVRLEAFDINTFSPRGSILIPNLPGPPSSLIRWGKDGLAFRTHDFDSAGQVFLIRTSLTPSDDVIPARIKLDTVMPRNEEGRYSTSFRIVRTGDTSSGATVQYATSDGTAKAGSDYTAANGTITFAPGESIQYVNVLHNNDALPEDDETFNFTLSNPTGAALAPPSTVQAIIVDDDKPSVQVTTQYTVGEPASGVRELAITFHLSGPSAKVVTMDYVTLEGTAQGGSDYAETSGTLTFNSGETTKSVVLQIKSDDFNETFEYFKLDLRNLNNVRLPWGFNGVFITILNEPTITLSASSYSFSENPIGPAKGYIFWPVSVSRNGDASAPATVEYQVIDQSGGNECDQVTGHASQRCDYTMSPAGTLRFAAGETSKTIWLAVINDGYAEGDETFSIRLQNPTGAIFGANAQASINIKDSGVVTTPATNPYLSNERFVGMNYLDFLGRDPDAQGFTDWTNVLNNCGPEKGFLGAPLNCDRAHVAHGFIASREFTEKGYLAYRMYEAALSRLPRYSEFISDMVALGGAPDSAELEQSIGQFAESFTARAEFTIKYADVSAPAQAALLIARLEQNAGVTLPATTTTLPGQPTQYNRQDLINLRLNGTFTLGQTLRAFVEQKVVYDKFFERGFVTMQYFGFLRRDPDLNDPNLSGWKEWVFVFTNGGAQRGRPDILPRDYHHLVFGFIYSEEYRKRFGQP